jgi:hypothetical protein
MGTLANFTLSKRREILEKSSVNEILQDSLLRSPLSDKVFGLSLQKAQEEVIKTPQPLRVNVQLTNGKRSASVFSLPLEQKEEEQETVPLLREVSATYKGATTYLRNPGFLAPLKPPF